MTGTALRNSAGQISIQVIEAIARVADVEPAALETPLYEVVDTDALNALVSKNSSVRVAFEYDDHDVVVTGNGSITVDGDAAGEI